MRIYGRDFINRLETCDWSVSELHYAESIEPDLRYRLALMQGEYI
jgi:hypothetical protein